MHERPSGQFSPALELKHHLLLVEVADTGSLAAAARRLSLTPSALSHQLRDAEERLGLRLFLRRHRKLLLSAAGEQVLPASRRVLAEAAAAEQRLLRAPQEALRVSTECYTCYGWLPRIFDRFQRRHPGVELRLAIEATRRPLQAMLAGELDLALVSEAPIGSRLRSLPLFADELVLLVRAGHPLAERGFARPEELAAEHLLTYDAPREQLDLYTRVLWPAGVEPRRTSRVFLSEAMVGLVRGGVGAAVLPAWAVPADPELAMVRISARGLRRRWRAVFPRSLQRWRPLLDLVELLRWQGAPALPPAARRSRGGPG